MEPTTPADAWGLTSSQVRRLFYVGLSALALTSFFRGFRPPSGWAATQFCLNYSGGFIRRGLVGELIRRLAGREVYSYQLVSVVALIMFAGTVCAFYRLFCRARSSAAPNQPILLTALVFAASPAFVVWVQELGYFDHLGLVALAGLIALLAAIGLEDEAFAAIAVGGTVLAAIAEVLIPMFAPTAAFALGCAWVGWQRKNPGRIAGLVRRALLIPACFFPVAYAIWTMGRLGTTTWPKIQPFKEAMEKAADFPVFWKVFDTLTLNFNDDFRHRMPAFWSVASNVAIARHQLLVMAPTLIMLFILGGVVVWRKSLPRWAKALVAIAGVCASLSPLSLNLVGWDTGRWIALCGIDAYCCIMAAQILLPEPEDARPAEVPFFVWGLGVVALVLEVSSDAKIFIDFPIQLFPFEDQVWVLFHWIFSGFKFVNGYGF